MHYKKNLFRVVLVGGDLFLLYTSLIGTLMIREGVWTIPATIPVFLHHYFFLQFPILIFLYLLDFYDFPPLKKIYDSLFRIPLFFLGSFCVSTVYFYFYQQGVVGPKTILLIHLGIFSLLIFLWRFLLKKVIPKRKQQCIILGVHPLLKELLPKMKEDFHIVSFFISSQEEGEYASFFFDKDMGAARTMDEVCEVVKRQKVDVVVSVSGDMSQVIILLPHLRGCIIQDVEQFYETFFLKVPLSFIQNQVTLRSIGLFTRRRWFLSFKRVFDISISILGLMFTTILMPFITIAVKGTSRGPLLYQQKRMGERGCVFTLYKFRTMYMNAEQDGPRLAQLNDTRVTSVGRFLRRCHLDELPQFFNVLRGELSFIGPRPERPEFTNELLENIPCYPLRHIMKPGMTGWAQVYYRASTTTEETREKFGYDIFYLKYCSFLLDFRITIKTIQMIMFNKKFS